MNKFFFCAPLISSSINQSKNKNRVCNITKETLYTSFLSRTVFAREKDREKKIIWKGTWYTCYYLLFRFVCLRVFAEVRKIKIQLKFVSTQRRIRWLHESFSIESTQVLLLFFYISVRLRDLSDFSCELVEQSTANTHSGPTYDHARYFLSLILY